ncbi:MAG: S8 family serine peptidase [Armatimonadetes bacterium]|nr:S8 family serine peptidase [Armatimonadota bacterium]
MFSVHSLLRTSLLGCGLAAAVLAGAQGRGTQNRNFIGPIDGMANQKPPRNVKLVPRPYTVLVAYKSTMAQRSMATVENQLGLYEDTSIHSPYFKRYFISQEAQLRGMTVDRAIAALHTLPNVSRAEYDMPVSPDQVNDPQYNLQWGLNNTGQTGGTPDADVDAPEAWPLIPTVSPVTVAVLDDGIEVGHPDLQANALVNSGEIPNNGIDDDGNGFVDDYLGWDFADNDNDPTPPDTSFSHGTHVSGIVAAVSNNALGVASASRNVKLLGVRFYRGQSTWISDLILAVDYARIRGAKVINISYNLDGWTQLLVDAFVRLKNADGVAMLSAGNNGEKDPARLGMLAQAPNLCFVAATDHNDQLASFSNYGAQVQVAAPGVDILSTVPFGSYDTYSGTSMASPFAASIMGTIRALYPSMTYSQAIARLGLTCDHKPQLNGKVTYGRVNLANAIQDDSVAPAPVSGLTLLRRSAGTFLVQFMASGDDGMVGAANYYDVRYSTSPITAANFSSAPQNLFATPTPGAGNPVKTSIGGLVPGSSYYIAVKALDDVGNESTITTAGPFTVLPALVYENMDGATSPFTPTGTWARTTDYANSGSQSWTDSPGGSYLNNANSTLTYNNAVNVTTPMAVTFLMRYDLESNYDYLYLEVSTDGGATWSQLTKTTGTSGSVFKSFTASLSNYIGQTVRLRFHMTSDSSVTYDGVYIDDFAVKALTTTFNDDVEGANMFDPTGSTWVVSTESAASPTHAWNDSPGANYVNNTNQWLKGIVNLDAEASGSPSVTFKGLINVENGYDFLNVSTSTDFGSSWVPQASYTGLGTSFASYTVPLGVLGTARVGFQLTSDSSVVANGAIIDDISVVGEPWVQQIDGTVGLNGFGGTKNFTVKLRTGSTIVATYPVTMTGLTGTFSFQTDKFGMYDVVIEGPSYLRRVIPGVNVTAFTTVSTSLVNGDIDGNNVIGTADFNAMRAAWGAVPSSSNWNPNADLNGDGVIGVADFNILRSNWGALGDL